MCRKLERIIHFIIIICTINSPPDRKTIQNPYPDANFIIKETLRRRLNSITVRSLPVGIAWKNIHLLRPVAPTTTQDHGTINHNYSDRSIPRIQFSHTSLLITMDSINITRSESCGAVGLHALPRH